MPPSCLPWRIICWTGPQHWKTSIIYISPVNHVNPRPMLQQRNVLIMLVMWGILPLETKWRSLAHANAGDHVDVWGPCYCQKPCRNPRPIQSLTVKDKEAPLAVVSMTTDTQLRKRGIESFCDNSLTTTPPLQKQQLRQEAIKGNLKFCDTYAEVKLSTIDVYWQGGGQEGLTFL